MKTNFPSRLSILLAGAVLALLAGCGTTEASRFYLLTPIDRPGGAPPAASPGEEPTVGVGPVVLAEYLDRSQIVTRTGRNEIVLAEFDRWAEPLKDSIARVLTENLSILLSTDSVSAYPWKTVKKPRFQVKVNVMRLDCREGGALTLQAGWSLLDSRGEKTVPLRRSLIVKPTGEEGDFSAIAAAAGEAVADLSREIAAAID